MSAVNLSTSSGFVYVKNFLNKANIFSLVAFVKSLKLTLIDGQSLTEVSSVLISWHFVVICRPFCGDVAL